MGDERGGSGPTPWWGAAVWARGVPRRPRASAAGVDARSLMGGGLPVATHRMRSAARPPRDTGDGRADGYETTLPIAGAGSFLYSAGPKLSVTACCQAPSLTIFSSASLMLFTVAVSPFLTPIP